MYAISIYVPSTIDINRTLTPAQHNVRALRVAKRIAQTFGGFTMTQGTGGWTTETGELVIESVAIVTTFTADPAAHETFAQWAQEYAAKWGQEAVTVTRQPLQYTFVTAE